MSVTTTTERLRTIMRERNLRQVDILEAAQPYCKQYGVHLDKSNISAYVSGKYVPGQQKLAILAMALDVSEGWLMGYDVPMERMDAHHSYTQVPINQHKIPLLGSVRCGEPEFADESFEGYVESGFQCDFALRAKGDSMIGARIHDGDIVFIRRQDTVEEGQIAVVILDDEATLKRVRYLGDGLTMLQAENSQYAPIIIGQKGETRSVRILGLAVAFQGRIK